jgi:hypothetical protein
MEGFDTMNDAPKKIWAWDFMVSKQNEFMTGGWHNETEDIDSDKETEYTRSDIAQARIEKLQDAIDLGVIQGDVVAHLTVVSLTARTEELEAVLRGLLNCLDNRLIGISSAREAARTALKETP